MRSPRIATFAAAALAAMTTIAIASPRTRVVPPEDDLPLSPSSLDDDLARRAHTIDFTDDIIGGFDHAQAALGLEPGDLELLRNPPNNPRIIDVELVHRRDCILDRIRGGQCVLRGFDQEPDPRIDVDAYGRDRAQRGRFEVIDCILDSADAL